MRPMFHSERVERAQREAQVETRTAAVAWEKNKRAFEARVDDMRARLSGIRAERTRAVEASARALIAGEAFDLSVLGRLQAEEEQAERAVQILEKEFAIAFVRIGPPVVYAGDVGPSFEIVREPRQV